ncbi:MAG: hypothetical protein J0M20_17255, partial [Burkholderiales bacterium]|nr:hypothetical protein [Burkholderiales bacterium]
MNTQGFTHLLGLWHPQQLPALQRGAAAADGQSLLLDEATLRVHGFGSDAWAGPTHLPDPDRLSVVLGEPLLLEGEQPQARERLLARLGQETPDALLPQCQGSFCGLRWQAGTGLQLFTDALGLRSFWWLPLGEGLAFSSHLGALRTLLRSLGEHPPIDEQGFAESLAFGISLGSRSCWQGLRRLRHGELLQADAQGVRVRTYRRFEVQVDESLDLDAATAALDAAFERAVTDRLQLLPRGERPRAFLSGGMDSRLVVSKLMARSAAQPLTLNVAPGGSQDAELGNTVASVLGTAHHHRPTTGSLLSGIQDSVAALQQAEPASARIWWSGDGGSVGLGHVYLTLASGLPAADDAPALARQLMDDNRWQFSGGALRASPRARWLALPQQGLQQELALLHRAGWQLDKQAFGFLLFNDQQRHLDTHFEALDQKTYDLSLPFFDARFIQQVLRTPTHHLLHHRLYNHLFATRLGAAGLAPWQSYPGHEPCPHPMPPGLREQ